MDVITEALTKLESEITRLETLYFVSTITYKREAKDRYRKSGGIDRPVEFKTSEWKREVAHNAGHFKAMVDGVLPKTLRETIFVRLVSALEVFHVDVVRAIYALRRDLLQRESTIELPYAYLARLDTLPELITRLVDRDCRKITSGGFEYATKFYKQRLNIELKSIPGYGNLKEIHDRRHILVHRLGYTDDQYRHSYSYARRRVSVDQPYLLTSIQFIRAFAQEVVKRSSSLVASSIAPASSRWLSDLTLHVKLQSLEAEAMTSPEFFFLYNEQYYCLRDLIRERTLLGEEVNLALRAKSNVLRVYLRKIKVLAKQNKLIIMTPSKTRNVKVLSEEIIQKVRQLLDTTSGVADEKVIAKELGLKAEMVKNAIRHLSLTKT
jgi:hypothetical protein